MPETMDKYKTYKNNLTNVIRYAKGQYYQDKFALANGNMNKNWQILTPMRKVNQLLIKLSLMICLQQTNLTLQINLMNTLSMWVQHWPIAYCQDLEMLPVRLRVAAQTV